VWAVWAVLVELEGIDKPGNSDNVDDAILAKRRVAMRFSKYYQLLLVPVLDI
jgi:hypothetical protein